MFFTCKSTNTAYNRTILCKTMSSMCHIVVLSWGKVALNQHVSSEINIVIEKWLPEYLCRYQPNCPLKSGEKKKFWRSFFVLKVQIFLCCHDLIRTFYSCHRHKPTLILKVNSRTSYPILSCWVGQSVSVHIENLRLVSYSKNSSC